MESKHVTPGETPAVRLTSALAGLVAEGAVSATGLEPSDVVGLLDSRIVDPGVLALLLATTPLTDDLVVAASNYPRPQVRHALVERYSELTQSQQTAVDAAATADTDAYVRAVVASSSSDVGVVSALACSPEAGVRLRAAARLEAAGLPVPEQVQPGDAVADASAAAAAAKAPAFGQPLDGDWEASSIASRLMAAGVSGILAPIDATAAQARHQLSVLAANPNGYDVSFFHRNVRDRLAAGRPTVEVLNELCGEITLTWGETANIGFTRDPQQVMLDVAARRTGPGTWQKPHRGSPETLAELTALSDGIIDAWMQEASAEAQARLRRAGFGYLQVERSIQLSQEQARDLGIPVSPGENFSGTSRHGVPVASISSYSIGHGRTRSPHETVVTRAVVPIDHIIAMDGAVGSGVTEGLSNLDMNEVLLTPIDPRRSRVEYDLGFDGDRFVVPIRAPVTMTPRRTPLEPENSKARRASQVGARKSSGWVH